MIPIAAAGAGKAKKKIGATGDCPWQLLYVTSILSESTSLGTILARVPIAVILDG